MKISKTWKREKMELEKKIRDLEIELGKMYNAGSFILIEDECDGGKKYWFGGCPGDKDVTQIEELILKPEHWAVGTVIRAIEPDGE